MKIRIYLPFLLTLFCCNVLQAQQIKQSEVQTQFCEDANKLMREGDAFSKAGNFENAIRKYTAAMINCAQLADLAQSKMIEVFKKIEALKKDAIIQKGYAEQSQIFATNEMKKADSLLKVAELEKRKAQSLVISATAGEQTSKNSTFSIRLAQLAWIKSPSHPPALTTQR